MPRGRRERRKKEIKFCQLSEPLNRNDGGIVAQIELDQHRRGSRFFFSGMNEE
jgi:hypothetical protein